MIFTSGRYLQVTSNSTPYVNMSNPSAGMLRYNGNSNTMEVYDGSSWIIINQSQSIGLSNDAVELLDWVHQHRAEEEKLRKMIEEHPGVRDAWEKLEIMKKLVLEEQS